MSIRGILASLGINLIATAIAWYFGGPNVGVLCFAVGVLFLVIAYFWPKKSEPQPPLPPPPPVQHNEQRVEVNPRQEQHLHLGAEFLQPLKEKPVSAPVAQQPKPQPNVRFVETKTITVHAGTGDGQLHESPQKLGDHYVSVVCFRTEGIVGRTIQQPRLKAHIVYKDKDGNEITDVPRAVWIGHYGDSVPFETGTKHCLIVFLLSNQGTLKKLWSESYTTSSSWMSGGPQFRIRDEGITGDVASVDVNLLSRDTCVLRAVFDVEEREKGKLPKLVLRSISGEELTSPASSC